MRRIIVLCLMIFIVGCGASTQFIMQDRNVRLRQFNNVYVSSFKTAGAVSVSGAAMGSSGAESSGSIATTGSTSGSGTARRTGDTTTANIAMQSHGSGVYRGSAAATASSVSGSHVMSGEDQAQIALERFKFELAKIGFNVVNDSQKADAYIDFSIGTIRYDILAGWIADEGMVKFINKTNDQTIAYFSADTKFITPTVSSVIKNLAARIKKAY